MLNLSQKESEMKTAELLNTYAEGWTKGDVDTILGATSDAFVFDDPNARKVSKGDFRAFFADMKETVATLRGDGYTGPFMELSEVLTAGDSEELTASCWWEIPGTNLRGGGLIKVTNEGVKSELITYYTQLPD